MKQKTWPSRSDCCRFASLPLSTAKSTPKSKQHCKKHNSRYHSKSPSSSDGRGFQFPPGTSSSSSPFSAPAVTTSAAAPGTGGCFTELPDDILTKIAANFSHPNLIAASLVCKSWHCGLRPLREAMLLLMWGKRFKHGRGGVEQNLEKALDSFLKGAARGLTLAMVDAGLMYWEMGKKDEGVALYKRAAELGDPAGQCNLGIAYLQAEPPRMKKAIGWLLRSASSGYVRAQYQLGLCLHHGQGIEHDRIGAANWYLKAAEGNYVRAMYNVARCYSTGEGFAPSRRQGKKWMKRAADHGHTKAQFEHGLTLYSDGHMIKAVVYMELASRGGDEAAANVRDVLLPQLTEAERDEAMYQADMWRALPSSR